MARRQERAESGKWEVRSGHNREWVFSVSCKRTERAIRENKTREQGERARRENKTREQDERTRRENKTREQDRQVESEKGRASAKSGDSTRSLKIFFCILFFIYLSLLLPSLSLPLSPSLSPSLSLLLFRSLPLSPTDEKSRSRDRLSPNFPLYLASQSADSSRGNCVRTPTRRRTSWCRSCRCARPGTPPRSPDPKRPPFQRSRFFLVLCNGAEIGSESRPH